MLDNVNLHRSVVLLQALLERMKLTDKCYWILPQFSRDQKIYIDNNCPRISNFTGEQLQFRRSCACSWTRRSHFRICSKMVALTKTVRTKCAKLDHQPAYILRATFIGDIASFEQQVSRSSLQQTLADLQRSQFLRRKAESDFSSLPVCVLDTFICTLARACS